MGLDSWLYCLHPTRLNVITKFVVFLLLLFGWLVGWLDFVVVVDGWLVLEFFVVVVVLLGFCCLVLLF